MIFCFWQSTVSDPKEVVLDEEWLELEEFPNYSVSTHGRVMNNLTERVMKLQRNRGGIVVVTFHEEGKAFLRAVKNLVSDTFLPRTHIIWTPEGTQDECEVPDNYTTPIQVDTDQTNCRVDNLAWRPRWFAMEYTRQFREPNVRHTFGPIVEIHTEERFATLSEAARAYGLIISGTGGLFQGVFYETLVMPTRQIFITIKK